MGSQTIIDLIASTMVFGFLLIIILRITASNGQNMQAYQNDLVVQENLVAVVQLLEYDFHKIAYCKDPTQIPFAQNAILKADTNKIIFLTDFATAAAPEGDGIRDTLSYYVGPTSEASNTPNPNDRLLYRVENSKTPIGVNMGLTTFNLKYYKSNGDQLEANVIPANLQFIQTMMITIEVQSYSGSIDSIWAGETKSKTDAQHSIYQSAYWRQIRMVSKNIQQR